MVPLMPNVIYWHNEKITTTNFRRLGLIMHTHLAKWPTYLCLPNSEDDWTSIYVKTCATFTWDLNDKIKTSTFTHLAKCLELRRLLSLSGRHSDRTEKVWEQITAMARAEVTTHHYDVHKSCKHTLQNVLNFVGCSPSAGGTATAQRKCESKLLRWPAPK